VPFIQDLITLVDFVLSTLPPRVTAGVVEITAFNFETELVGEVLLQFYAPW